MECNYMFMFTLKNLARKGLSFEMLFVLTRNYSPTVYCYKSYADTLGIFNTLRQRQNGRHFPNDNFKWIFLNENVWISINISLKFVPWGPINNIPTLVQIMAWRWPDDKPLSKPMMVRLLTHICVTEPQWVNAADVRKPLWHGLVSNKFVIILESIIFSCRTWPWLTIHITTHVLSVVFGWIPQRES